MSASRLTVLTYHRVLREPDPLNAGDIDAPGFDMQMRVLRSLFNVLPLPEALAQLQRRELVPRAVALTFDDGYADNAEVALPILRAHGLAATFFIATGYLDGGYMWNDGVAEAIRHATLREIDGLPLDSTAARMRAIDTLRDRLKYLSPEERDAAVTALLNRCNAPPPRDLMMTSAQIRKLAESGMTLGGHTVRHPILKVLDESRARAEITSGKQQLESILDKPVELFAYPNGRPGQDYGEREVSLVREAGFTAAFSTRHGMVTGGTEPFEQPRMNPWQRTRTAFAGALLAAHWLGRE
jgi:peptidoglycan/xylan/chitin deacetylase (PgdA/CDA1 family)